MKLKVISPIAAHAEAWRNALSRGDLQGSVEAITRPLHEVNVLVNGSRPDLVVVEVADADARDLRAGDRSAVVDGRHRRVFTINHATIVDHITARESIHH